MLTRNMNRQGGKSRTTIMDQFLSFDAFGEQFKFKLPGGKDTY